MGISLTNASGQNLTLIMPNGDQVDFNNGQITTSQLNRHIYYRGPEQR